MESHELSPEQQKQIEADYADFERQLVRTGVDLRAAWPQLNEIEPPRRRDVTDGEGDGSFIEEVIVDFSGILETLRRLPDGVGTTAFVTAYNASHPDWRDDGFRERST